MKKILLLTCLLLTTLLASAQDLTGTWKGKLALPNGQLNLVFHISHNGESYKATCDSPDQGVKGIPTESVTFVNSASLDFATDATAALRYLQSRKEINPKKKEPRASLQKRGQSPKAGTGTQ